MSPRSPQSTFTLSSRRPRMWLATILLLIAAQVGLLIHHFEHDVHFELGAATEECALCSFASNMATGPDKQTFAPPILILVQLSLVPRTQTIVGYNAQDAFRARGPPPLLSA